MHTFTPIYIHIYTIYMVRELEVTACLSRGGTQALTVRVSVEVGPGQCQLASAFHLLAFGASDP